MQVQQRSIFGPDAGEMAASLQLEVAVVKATSEATTPESKRRLARLWRAYVASCGTSWKCLQYGCHEIAPAGRGFCPAHDNDRGRVTT